jgi:hypothetical protein
LSTKAVLGEGKVDTDLSLRHYAARVLVIPIAGLSADASEVLRLAPPEGLLAPTFLVTRAVTQLFQDGKNVMQQTVPAHQPVTVSGTVAEADSAEPTSATLTFWANSLDGIAAGTVAGLRAQVATSEAGKFETALLPGTYRVVIEPTDHVLAQTETTITVLPDTAQQGVLFGVKARRTLRGELLTAMGAGLSSAQLQLVAEPIVADQGVYSMMAGWATLVPGAQPAMSDASGSFELLSDAGRFDLVVQTEAASAVGWSARLGVDVGDGTVDLGKLVVGAPSQLRGMVYSQDVGVVASALVRAYAYVGGGQFLNKADKAEYVLPVGEARVSPAGEYTLYVPAVLTGAR